MTINQITALTPGERNALIAKHLGWKKWEPEINDGGWNWTPPGKHHVDFLTAECPNYCGSLDLMAEAEKTLNDDQQVRCEKFLWDIVKPETGFRGPKGYGHLCFQIAKAKSDHRAMAFLATVLPLSL